jgi:hypothetical protein
MDDKKKGKQGKGKLPTDSDPGKVRIVAKITREALDGLAQVRMKYPEVPPSKGHQIDAAIKSWTRQALLYGLDGHLQPMLPASGSPPLPVPHAAS